MMFQTVQKLKDVKKELKILNRAAFSDIQIADGLIEMMVLLAKRS